jgi:hypothetical protein
MRDGTNPNLLLEALTATEVRQLQDGLVEKQVKRNLIPVRDLTYTTSCYTLRIHDRARIKGHTREARLVAGASCRSGRSRSEQHCAPGAGRARDQGIFGPAYPIGCRAK